MEVWLDQLHDMLDQAAVYAEDWSSCLDMLGEAQESKELYNFMNLFVPRLERMQRRWNQVSFVPKPNNASYWEIANYNYNLYRYMVKKYGEALVITSHYIRIRDDALTAADRDKLQAQL